MSRVPSDAALRRARAAAAQRMRRTALAGASALARVAGATPPGQPPPATADYPYEPRPRHGWGRPPHPELDAVLRERREHMRARLQGFRRYLPQLERIALQESAPGEPYWAQRWFTGLDATALYCTLAERDPALYIEVGSGSSTRFARRAVRDWKLRTSIVSIDPAPRLEVDRLCDEVVRQRLEDVDLSRFGVLADNDIFFVDGSHRTLMNSDATVALLEILPRLNPGVLVHIHDILWPWDYPDVWSRREYSEQYAVAALLLARGTLVEVDLANHFITQDTELHAILDPLWQRLGAAGVETNGLSLWLRRG
jgi:hypothetical protein